jgi:hypothetical protein
VFAPHEGGRPGEVVAVRVHRRGHHVLTHGPHPIRGRASATRRHRYGDRAAGRGPGGPRWLVISSDFYAVYTSAEKKTDGLVNLYFCRYFVRAGDANPAQLAYWTAAWLSTSRPCTPQRRQSRSPIRTWNASCLERRTRRPARLGTTALARPTPDHHNCGVTATNTVTLPVGMPAHRISKYLQASVIKSNSV